MATVMQAIRSNVETESKIVALKNCFYTWDGNIDIDVIVGGIQDRVKALDGVRPESVEIDIIALSMVKVTVENKINLLFKNGYLVPSHGKGLTYFHLEEIEILGKFLNEEFYYR